MIESIITLALLAGVSFAQNMMFTLVSRSRAGGDPNYHRLCAWGSNGVWIICYLLILKNVWASVQAGNWLYAGIAVIVYTLATTEGSVLMMKRLLKSEKGKRKVGATGGESDPDKLLERIRSLEATLSLNVEGGTALDYKMMARIEQLEKRLDVPFDDGSRAEVLRRLAVVEHAIRVAEEENKEIERDNEKIQAENNEAIDEQVNLRRRISVLESKVRINKFLRNAIRDKVDKHEGIISEMDSALYGILYRASDDPNGVDEEFDVQERIIALEKLLTEPADEDDPFNDRPRIDAMYQTLLDQQS